MWQQLVRESDEGNANHRIVAPRPGSYFNDSFLAVNQNSTALT
jgi:hypothetical protein